MPILIEIDQNDLKGFEESNCTVGQCTLRNAHTDLRGCTAYAGSLIYGKEFGTLLIHMLQPLFAPVLTYNDQANVRLYFKPGSEYPYSACVETLLLYFTLPLYFKLYYNYMIYYITQHGMRSHNGLMVDISVYGSDKHDKHDELKISMRVNVEQGLAVRLTPTFLL